MKFRADIEVRGGQPPKLIPIIHVVGDADRWTAMVLNDTVGFVGGERGYCFKQFARDDGVDTVYSVVYDGLHLIFYDDGAEVLKERLFLLTVTEESLVKVGDYSYATEQAEGYCIRHSFIVDDIEQCPFEATKPVIVTDNLLSLQNELRAIDEIIDRYGLAVSCNNGVQDLDNAVAALKKNNEEMAAANLALVEKLKASDKKNKSLSTKLEGVRHFSICGEDFIGESVSLIVRIPADGYKVWPKWMVKCSTLVK